MADQAQPPRDDGPVRELRDAAEDAGRAPSILNTQPWHWHVSNRTLELRADRDRQVDSIDPSGRLLLLSCGAGLQHARVALAYRGHEPSVDRFPDAGDEDLLARVSLAGPHEVTRHDVDLHRSIRQRRTERRPAPAVRVPDEAIAALCRSAGVDGVWLHHLKPDQVPILADAVRAAEAAEASQQRYATDLRTWGRRSHSSGQGVPSETVVAPVTRPVPLRDLTAGGATLLHPGFGDDAFAEYFIVTTAADRPSDWLRGGEATSSAWLTATTHGLSGSVISDVIEVPAARELMAPILAHRCAQLVMRMAMALQPTPPPATPRRPPGEYVEVDAGAGA